jgi:hypothetical protein
MTRMVLPLATATAELLRRSIESRWFYPLLVLVCGLNLAMAALTIVQPAAVRAAELVRRAAARATVG